MQRTQTLENVPSEIDIQLLIPSQGPTPTLKEISQAVEKNEPIEEAIEVTVDPRDPQEALLADHDFLRQVKGIDPITKEPLVNGAGDGVVSGSLKAATNTKDAIELAGFAMALMTGTPGMNEVIQAGMGEAAEMAAEKTVIGGVEQAEKKVGRGQRDRDESPTLGF